MCPTSPQLDAEPSQAGQRKSTQLKATGKPLVPRPQGHSHPGAGLSSGAGPPGYKDKELYSQAAPRCLLPLSLSLFSLFSSVTVKRHRGCDCHLYRQSVRLPKANQSSLLCLFPPQHLPPPALRLPTPDSRAGWGQSRTTETVETAGAKPISPDQTAAEAGENLTQFM